MDNSEKLCLIWNYFEENQKSSFALLRNAANELGAYSLKRNVTTQEDTQSFFFQEASHLPKYQPESDLHQLKES